jgi:hypothetical protein
MFTMKLETTKYVASASLGDPRLPTRGRRRQKRRGKEQQQ